MNCNVQSYNGFDTSNFVYERALSPKREFFVQRNSRHPIWHLTSSRCASGPVNISGHLSRFALNRQRYPSLGTRLTSLVDILVTITYVRESGQLFFLVGEVCTKNSGNKFFNDESRSENELVHLVSDNQQRPATFSSTVAEINVESDGFVCWF